MLPAIAEIGAYISPRASIAPQSSAASATTDGTGIERTEFQSCVLSAQVGAATGAPSGVSVTFKVQHSADDVTYTDYTPDRGAASVVADAASKLVRVNVDLAAAKKYIRVRAVAALTGGSSPTIPIAASVIVGGGRTLPTPDA